MWWSGMDGHPSKIHGQGYEQYPILSVKLNAKVASFGADQLHIFPSLGYMSTLSHRTLKSLVLVIWEAAAWERFQLGLADCSLVVTLG
ncbi:uncharacterized protein G2W53_041240 [Senna tora]|uniref:Uncharacterized protein n=1 Tax=Senna tora TaxID=362788 RepID=A0A834W2Q1_9FABA|nr:uncharacterized protein G2W53_041240 [Senna tora]